MRARATRDEAGDDRGDGGDERVRRRCERTDAHFDAGGELQAQYVEYDDGISERRQRAHEY